MSPCPAGPRGLHPPPGRGPTGERGDSPVLCLHLLGHLQSILLHQAVLRWRLPPGQDGGWVIGTAPPSRGTGSSWDGGHTHAQVLLGAHQEEDDVGWVILLQGISQPLPAGATVTGRWPSAALSLAHRSIAGSPTPARLLPPNHPYHPPRSTPVPPGPFAHVSPTACAPGTQRR